MSARETEMPTEALTAVRRAALQDPDLPSGLRRALESGAALEDIALDDRGRWWHEGVRIEHKRLSTLFHRGLEQTRSGTWLIALPPYSYPVRVARWGSFVVRLGATELTLATGAEVPYVEVDRWLTDGEDTVLAEVGGVRARVVGRAWQALVPCVGEGEGGFVLQLPTGATVPLIALPG